MRRNTRNPGPDGFTLQDAWVLSRLRTDLAQEADLSAASPAFEPLARRFLALPPSDREAVVNAWLETCPDAEAIRER